MWPFYSRSRKLPHSEERVLLVGASSGLGQVIAHKFAAKGTRLCLVARREEELAKVVQECQRFRAEATKATSTEDSDAIFYIKADFTSIDDILAVRDKLQDVWGGIDTLIVNAAIVTLCTVYELAGLEMTNRTKFTPSHADKAGIQNVVDVAHQAVEANYIGPLITITAFIPMLAQSTAPAVMHISTLGAVVPAPSLSIYNATKAAALMQYQVLAVEHPNIAFTWVLPSVMKGENFFKYPAGGGTPRSGDPSEYGITHEYVAKRCVAAVDKGDSTVFVPGYFGWAALLGYWVTPSIVLGIVRNMYHYHV